MAFPNAGLSGSLSHPGPQRESWGGHEKEKANEAHSQPPKLQSLDKHSKHFLVAHYVLR